MVLLIRFGSGGVLSRYAATVMLPTNTNNSISSAERSQTGKSHNFGSKVRDKEGKILALYFGLILYLNFYVYF